jgi:hypothetical protein
MQGDEDHFGQAPSRKNPKKTNWMEPNLPKIRKDGLGQISLASHR